MSGGNPWKPGQSGNPAGRRKEKPFRDALNIVINEAMEVEGVGAVKRLRLIAVALAAKAMEGDVGAIREIADRLDGKAVQQTILNGDDDGGPVVIEKVERVIVDPKTIA